jgi:ABC-type nitrate/sulfonate/bicarbonate transport system permease component
MRTALVMSGMLAIGLVRFLFDVLLRSLEARIQKNRGLA